MDDERTTTLESLRRGRGWSKSELARRARLDNSRLSKIESRRYTPYPGELRRLAKALGVKDATGLLNTIAPTDPVGSSLGAGGDQFN